MTNADLLKKLKKLADEGEILLQAGYEIPSDPLSTPSLQVFDWLLRCNSFITNIYGKNSDVINEFSQAYTLRMSVNMLVSLASKLHVSAESLNP